MKFNLFAPFCCINIITKTHLYVCIVSPHLQVSHPQMQPTADQKRYFQSIVGNLKMWRADCMHCSTLFYLRDWSIHGFWYLQEEEVSWNQSPAGVQGLPYIFIFDLLSDVFISKFLFWKKYILKSTKSTKHLKE